MDDSKRNQRNKPAGQQQTESPTGEKNSPQNEANQQEENPQRGTSWNNYQTREMGSSPDQDSSRSEQEEDTGGGGTLY